MSVYFITGAAGYIGGSVALRLRADGHRVRALVRRPDAAQALARLGLEPVPGGLDDHALLVAEARAADGVINTASADHAGCIAAFIEGLQGSGKPLIHTSGTSVVADDAGGEAPLRGAVDEQGPLLVQPLKQPRRDIDLQVLSAAAQGVRSAVVCPSLIYGLGHGLKRDSVQIPFLADNARAQGLVQLVGRGLNHWSTVHLDDLVDLYARVLAQAGAGALYFAENGEVSFQALGQAIARRLGLPGVVALPPDEAAARWGVARAHFSLGSNSQVRARRARQELGWAPRHDDVLDWILKAMPLSAPPDAPN